MNYDCFSSLLSLSKFKLRSYMEDDLIRRVLQTRDDKMVKILCESVPKSSTFVKELICIVIEKDNLDLCNALMTSMLKSDEYVIENVTRDDRIVWYAILGRNPQIVSLLIHNKIGVTPNLKNKRNINLLKWAKILKLPAIYEMLIAAGCEPFSTDHHHHRPSCVFKEVVKSRIRTHAMENIKVLVEESGFDPNGEDHNFQLPPVYSAFRARKFDIVEYLIMKGASLKINKATESMFHCALCCKKLGEMFYQSWCQLTMILIDTNAQFLVHFNKAVLFNIINYNVVLLDIFYRLSHTIPLSIQQNLEEYRATCDKPKATSSVEGGDQNQLRYEIIETLLYKPRSLQLACRNAFRRQFGCNVSAVISSLGDDVPRRVIEFLNFDDVISDLEEHLKYEK